MRNALARVALCGLALALLSLAPAAAAPSEPAVLVTIRAVEFDAYTGNVTVKARVSCSHADTASWNAQLVQDVKAKGSRPITCDGERRRSRIVLDPANGRFHAGPAELGYGALACNDTSCVVFSANQSVTLTHTP